MPEVTLACLTPKNGVYFDAQNSREYSRKKHLKKCCILMPLVRQSDFRHLYDNQNKVTGTINYYKALRHRCQMADDEVSKTMITRNNTISVVKLSPILMATRNWNIVVKRVKKSSAFRLPF